MRPWARGRELLTEMHDVTSSCKPVPVNAPLGQSSGMYRLMSLCSRDVRHDIWSWVNGVRIGGL